jgi:hypothetical protein
MCGRCVRFEVFGVKITVKSLYIIDEGPRHEDLWRRGSIASPFFLLRHYMEMSVQLHVPTALLPGKATLLPNG